MTSHVPSYETSARNVAAHLLAIGRERDIEITNLKLQKLLYYCQAWFLAIHEKPLFADRIEAWVHGPVVPPVFGDFKHFRWSPITSVPPGSHASKLALDHIAEVMDAYGTYSATDLEHFTHRERPWQIARACVAADVVWNGIITHDSMKEYYSSLLI